MSILSPTPVTRTIAHVETLRRNSDGSFPTLAGVVPASTSPLDQPTSTLTPTAPQIVPTTASPSSAASGSFTGGARDSSWQNAAPNGKLVNSPAPFAKSDQLAYNGQFNKSGLIVGLSILAFIFLAIGVWYYRCCMRKRWLRKQSRLTMDVEEGPYYRQAASADSSAIFLEKDAYSGYQSFSQPFFQYPVSPAVSNIGVATTTDSIPRAASKEAITYLQRNSRLSPVSSDLTSEDEPAKGLTPTDYCVSEPDPPQRVKTRNSKSFVPLQNPVNLTVDMMASKDAARVSYKSPTETIYKCYNDRDSLAPSLLSEAGKAQVSTSKPIPPIPQGHLKGPMI